MGNVEWLFIPNNSKPHSYAEFFSKLENLVDIKKETKYKIMTKNKQQNKNKLK
jgi:hypothetical protein